jgi:hypothetical protein
MASHPSRDELRSELRRQRLPQAYITRLLAELDDHYEDLLEERSTSMGAARKLQVSQNEQNDLQQRLGEPAQLALFAGEQYHARSFWGQYPWVTYLLAPLPLFFVCWIFFVLAFSAVVNCILFVGVRAFGWPEDVRVVFEHSVWRQAILIAFTSWYVIVLPPLTAAWILCRTYGRNALNWRWPMVGCALLAITAGCFEVSYRIATKPGNGMFMFGWNFHGSASWLLLSFLPRFVLAMGIGLLLVKRARQQLEVEG